MSAGADRFETTLSTVFASALAATPDRVWLSALGPEDAFSARWTLAETSARVNALAARMRGAGIEAGDRVATILDNTPDHVVAILALARLGAVWVPVHRETTAQALSATLARARPVAALAHAPYSAAILAAELPGPVLDPSEPGAPCTGVLPAPHATPDDWRAIMFTSGTTGLPKGVIVTERMFCAAGTLAAGASDAGPDEVFLLWEPLNHIGGAQMIPAALMSGASLVMVPRFSASRFWAQAKAAGATRIHYLGGVLDLLAKQPPGQGDRDHGVTRGFGAAARPGMWTLFPKRFGVTLTEVYGQTEAASFCVTNRDGTPGAIGTPLPPFDIALLDERGREVPQGGIGEIAIAATPRGLLTPGYLDDPATTEAAFVGGRFHTGDLARRDEAGRLYFAGRRKEAIRRRGENVSALEVETAISAHPAVSECAVLGVPADIGEEEILALIELVPGADLAPSDLIDWLRGRLSPFQLPRFVRRVDGFPRTPSHRIAKSEIPRDTAEAWDSEAGKVRC